MVNKSTLMEYLCDKNMGECLRCKAYNTSDKICLFENLDDLIEGYNIEEEMTTEHTYLDDLINLQVEEDSSKYDDLYKEYEELPQYEKFYKR